VVDVAFFTHDNVANSDIAYRSSTLMGCISWVVPSPNVFSHIHSPPSLINNIINDIIIREEWEGETQDPI